jgi:hypothetical protein
MHILVFNTLSIDPQRLGPATPRMLRRGFPPANLRAAAQIASAMTAGAACGRTIIVVRPSAGVPRPTGGLRGDLLRSN